MSTYSWEKVADTIVKHGGSGLIGKIIKREGNYLTVKWENGIIGNCWSGEVTSIDGSEVYEDSEVDEDF